MKNKAEWYWDDPSLYEDCESVPSLSDAYFDIRVAPTERELQVVTAALARYDGPPLVTVSALERFLQEVAEDLGSVSVH